MDQAHTVDSTQQAPTQRELEIQFSKWFEKMQAHCSSHHIAGTLETPASQPEAGDLEQLQAEGDQHSRLV